MKLIMLIHAQVTLTGYVGPRCRSHITSYNAVPLWEMQIGGVTARVCWGYSVATGLHGKSCGKALVYPHSCSILHKTQRSCVILDLCSRSKGSECVGKIWTLWSPKPCLLLPVSYARLTWCCNSMGITFGAMTTTSRAWALWLVE